MSDKPGLVDPWRVVEPVQAPVRSQARQQKRINLADQDFDADMAPVRVGALDSRHGMLEVHSKQLHHMGDVLKSVVCCLFDLERKFKDIKFAKFEVSFRIGEQRSSGWKSTSSAGWHTEAGFEPSCELRFNMRQSFDGGMLRLLRTLCDLQRRPGGPAILNKWGVRIILR